ncbi:hypothetical protein CN680_23400 [Bacillus pseudomycoides]|uniref:Uncharacterized protein n=1 Tax=Bacillus pseudomycoides TaxID=64104 RepID=A0A2B4MEA4_9BACI|nr:hypothetical protein CON79_02770 [Bacillus pseudomycoides]PED05629.1 hypothetical protein COO19_25420 [Bacillus pseudomycoides]PED71701.1 hypothetical protein CON97_12650 [Bacillus pseudomycoides]PEI39872.1 hypothetical protein CN620_18040 [Bacillus pseudomycoides]PEJ71107.1 hypothetical protein CN680_23400 [Bacillus pseudomycoides]
MIFLVSKLFYPSPCKNPHFIIYKPNLIFQHINHCYKKQKVTCTHFLSLFSLRMGLEKDLTASIHGEFSLPPKD